jgi:hypothetical protein
VRPRQDVRVCTKKIKKKNYFVDMKAKASYTKSMKKIKIYTQQDYRRQLERENAFVNVAMAITCYALGMTLLYMGLV